MSEHRARQYFSSWAGPSILEHVAAVLPPSGLVLDVGAGVGDLVSLLFDRGYQVAAIEDSAASLTHITARYPARPLTLARSTAELATGSAAAAFAIELTEHLQHNEAMALWADVRRVLRPGGILVVTTPHEEHLGDQMTCCPNCRATFHTVQHIRRFTVAKMEREMTDAGFATLRCEAVYFSGLRGVRRRLERIRRWFGTYPRPHLLYVGRA